MGNATQCPLLGLGGGVHVAVTAYDPQGRESWYMISPVTVSELAPPTGSRLIIQVAVSADFNISAEVARQRANRFLTMNLGDQLYAGVPELVIGEQLSWRVPVHLALSRGGYLGKVGDLRIDAQTGDLELESPQTLAQLTDHAEVLYERAALSATTGE